jgi:UDP-glucose 4-epimerase
VRIVVTGGAGFIGANLCRRLVDDGAEVVVVDDLSTGAQANLAGLGVTLHLGSILDPSLLDVACARADAVVHLAARGSVPLSVEDPLASHERNVTGTAQVLEAARRAGGLHTIVASSSSVYGSNPHMPRHEGLVPMPVSPYAATKLATESYALAWSEVYGLPVLAFRFFNVYGPLQSPDHAYAAVIPAFVDAAVAGRPLPMHGDGTQTRDFTYVRTVCDVLTTALTGAVTHEGPVNLAFGTRVSLLELVDELEQLIGHPVAREELPVRAGDVRESQASTERLRSLFGSVVPVPLAVGLDETLRWHRGRAARR